MYRRGVVSQVDVKSGRVRVRWPDKGDAESFWLEVLQRSVDDDTKDFDLPKPGTLVAVLMDAKSEAGCVLGAVYTTAQPPAGESSQDVRSVTFPGGVTCEYNRATKTLKVEGPALVRFGAESIEFDGPTKVAGGAEPVALAEKVTAQLNALKSAIAGAPPTPGDGGLALKTAIVSALSAWPGDVASGALTSD